MKASPALSCGGISSAVQRLRLLPRPLHRRPGGRTGRRSRPSPPRILSAEPARRLPGGAWRAAVQGAAPAAEWFPRENAKANRGPFGSTPEPCERGTRCIYLGCNSLCQAHKMFTTCISARTRYKTGDWVLADISPGCFSLSSPLLSFLFSLFIYTRWYYRQTHCLYYVSLHNTQYFTESDCEKGFITSRALSVAMYPSIRQKAWFL